MRKQEEIKIMTKEQLKAKKEVLIKKWDESFEKLEDAKSVLSTAKEITNAIKYADTSHIIISKLSTLADENNIDESEQDYHLNKIREQMQELQKACYDAEDMFGDIVSTLECEHDDIDSEYDELKYLENEYESDLYELTYEVK
tara:strand:+ start:102 stop:530 length:429 start_codon:yes stop_codon:yes gene_type:complete